MSTYETAQNAYLIIFNIRFAYRLFGNPNNAPLVFNMHFRGTMDYWDPLPLNTIAARRPVLLVDNFGVGASSGTTPDAFVVGADYMVQITQALGFTSVDVFGFSMATRRISSSWRSRARKESAKDGRHSKAGEMWWKRTTAARKSEARCLTGDDVDLQLSAILKWYDEYRKGGSYDRLGEIRCPVLVAGGRNDMLIPHENSYLLWQILVNLDAYLHLYPGSGHGFLNENHQQFAEMVNSSLDEPGREDEDWV